MIMNNQDQNWQNLFGDYTTERTPWYGKWVTYAANQKVVKSQRVIRSFQMNTDNTAVAHTNRYLDDSNSIIDEKNWQISREVRNLPDGVVHPAMPWLRALAPQTDTAAWLSPQLLPGKSFGAELFFRDGNWRSSVVIAYGANGQLDRIIHIREHLGCFFEQPIITEPIELTENWLAEQRFMTANLDISPAEKAQICFAQLSDGCKLLSLPEGMSLILPKMVTADQPFQIAALQQTIEQQLKLATVHYTAAGKFSRLTSATLHQQIQSVSDHSAAKASLLYPRYSCRGDFSPEQVVFNANLQEFAQKVAYLSAFHTGGKMTTEQIYTDLKTSWRQLEQSHQQLLGTN